MRHVNLDDLEACLPSVAGGGGKRFADAFHIRLHHFPGDGVSFGEGHRAGSDRLPSPVPGVQRLSSPPGNVGRGFPAGVRDLDTGHRSMLVDESGDFPEYRSLFPGPDPRIEGCDPSFRGNRGGFRHHQGGASDRPTPQVHQMPIRRHSIDGGILAHRGDEDPVLEYQFPQAKGGKQSRSVHEGSLRFNRFRHRHHPPPVNLASRFCPSVSLAYPYLRSEVIRTCPLLWTLLRRIPRESDFRATVAVGFPAIRC